VPIPEIEKREGTRSLAPTPVSAPGSALGLLPSRALSSAHSEVKPSMNDARNNEEKDDAVIEQADNRGCPATFACGYVPNRSTWRSFEGPGQLHSTQSPM